MKVDSSPSAAVANLVAPAARDTAGLSPDAVTRPDVAIRPEGPAKQDPKLDPNGAQGQSGRRVKKEELAEVVNKMNETLKIFNRALEFKVADSGRVIVKVVDTDSGQVIRQIPPETMLDMYDRMDKMLGVLVDRKV